MSALDSQHLLAQTFSLLADWLKAAKLSDGQTLWLAFQGEHSEFVRFNHARVRQVGQVQALDLSLSLVQAIKAETNVTQFAQVQSALRLTGDASQDLALCEQALHALQAVVKQARPDPFALFSHLPTESEAIQVSESDQGLPPLDTMVQCILDAANASIDLVGFLASGPLAYGVLSSLGHQHYQSRDSFFFDFSVYAGGLDPRYRAGKPVSVRDKAVKRSLAASLWDARVIQNAISEAAKQSELLMLSPKQLGPGAYRAWLAPAAVAELLSMLTWGGLSAGQLRRGASPLEKAFGGISGSLDASQTADLPTSFSKLFRLSDAPLEAGVPRFQSQGFVGPATLDFFDAGQAKNLLVSPRTALEFGLQHNGYAEESPRALKLHPGALNERDAMRELGTGIFVSNLWYLNFSDRMSCSVTGMTRFATLWVENGEPVAPLAAMRIDDSLYDIFGKNLLSLGDQAHWLADVSTYDKRCFGGTFAPGILLSGLKLTL